MKVKFRLKFEPGTPSKGSILHELFVTLEGREKSHESIEKRKDEKMEEATCIIWREDIDNHKGKENRTSYQRGLMGKMMQMVFFSATDWEDAGKKDIKIL